MATERPVGFDVGGQEDLRPFAQSETGGLGNSAVEKTSSGNVLEQGRILEMLARIGCRKEKPKGLSARRSNTNGWEPFNSDPDPANQKFINLYGGAFSQQIELARDKVEGLLKVAAIDGKVILTNNVC